MMYTAKEQIQTHKIAGYTIKIHFISVLHNIIFSNLT